MSSEDVKKSTKGYKKSGKQEEGQFKRKKNKKLAPESANDGKDDWSLADSAELELATPTPVDPSKGSLEALDAKTSRKRKRGEGRDAMLDRSVEPKADNNTGLRLEPQKNKRWTEHREEDRTEHRDLPFPDPAIDESLSEQSRRALSYAYERCRENRTWKFNKARQNWLLRNLWSAQTVPENYVPLVAKYLVGIKGSARKSLIEECTTKMSIEDGQPLGRYIGDGSTIEQWHPSARASTILEALHEKD